MKAQLLVFLLASAAGTAAANPGLDISDVSALLPIPNPDKRLPSDIKLSDSGAVGVVFSKENFKRLPLFAKQFSNLDAAYKNAYITGFRLDACAPQVDKEASPESCKVSLIRLIGQVMEKKDGKWRVADAGMHLIYAFKLNADVVKELVALKDLAQRAGAPTKGESLGVHPALRGDYSTDEKKVKFATAFRKFILSKAGKLSQIDVSHMVTFSNKEKDTITWEWAPTTFSIAKKTILIEGEKGYKEAYAAAVVATAEGKPHSQKFIAKRGERQGTISPRSLVVPHIAALLSNEPPSLDKNPKAYGAALQIENPQATMIPQGDCASCHVATSYRLFASAQTGSNPTGGFSAAENITDTMTPQIEKSMTNDRYLVLNFGYVFRKPSVSQRTVNESVEVVRFLNKNF